MSDKPETTRRARYWCREPGALARAAGHGCLGEDVENGEPTVCGVCIDTPSGSDGAS